MSPGAAVHVSEIRKHNSNDGKCGELGWVCIPLVVETYDAWGQEAVKSLFSWHLGWQSSAPSQSLSSYMTYMAD